MAYYYYRDIWGRHHVRSESAPKETNPTRLIGTVDFDHPAAYEHDVALVQDKMLAKLIVSVANFRGKSAEEWCELQRIFDQVNQDEKWMGELQDFGCRAIIVDSDRRNVATIFKMDGTNIEMEYNFIFQVREQAARLLRESAAELFAELETDEGEVYVLAREDLAWLGPVLPAQMRDGEFYGRDGKLLAEHLLDRPLGRCERVTYLDRNPRNVYKPNIERAPDRQTVHLAVPSHVASALGNDPGAEVQQMVNEGQ